MKSFFRWLKDLFAIGLKRSIEEDDIYEVLDGMRSDKITKKFVKSWDEELQKESPSILRVIYKLYGFKVLSLAIFLSLTSGLAQ